MSPNCFPAKVLAVQCSKRSVTGLRRIQGAKKVASESAAKQLEMQLARESERQRQELLEVDTVYFGKASSHDVFRVFRHGI